MSLPLQQKHTNGESKTGVMAKFDLSSLCLKDFSEKGKRVEEPSTVV